MRLYLLTYQPDTDLRWDVYLGFVVSAYTAKEARELIVKANCLYLDQEVKDFSCKIIGHSSTSISKIILSSFKAG
jgi:hypothetical protein